MQRLTAVNSVPTTGMAEAAELLCRELRVSVVSITAVTASGGPYVLMAAYGRGADLLGAAPVMEGGEWSARRLADSGAAHLRVSVPDALPVSLGALPRDWAALADVGGLRSFLAVPVAIGADVAGVLSVAAMDEEALPVDTWVPTLAMLAVGLLAPLRSDHTVGVCRVLCDVYSRDSALDVISALLQGASSLLQRATNIPMALLLGLLDGGPGSGRALVFEAPLQRDGAGALGGLGKAQQAQQGQQAQRSLQITQLVLTNTLLGDALGQRRARYVSDVASYMQSCMAPAADVFICASQCVASIVALPLVGAPNGGSVAAPPPPLGGLYVALDTPSNFQHIKQLLLGFVRMAHLVLAAKLGPQMSGLHEAVLQGGATLHDAPAAGALPRARADGTLNSGGSAGSGGSGNAVGGAGGGDQQRKVFAKRNVTEAMLKVLQHEIRRTNDMRTQQQWVEDLQVIEPLGKGGFGVVYAATWRGCEVAAKVMYARQHERQSMKDALEMAVVSSISHPNIIQVFTCMTDMVEDESLASAGGGVRFRRVAPGEDEGVAACSVVVMELCDKGSLRKALTRGAFHVRIHTGQLAVDLVGILQVLLEVAQAVQHLHAMKLLHCDIKPENVLLKSEPTKPLGFVCKLSDFGMAKMLRESNYLRNHSGSGTITHLAPELFQVGSKVTPAVDTYSFGIMMWELYTAQRAHTGLGQQEILDQVCFKQARPVFPDGSPDTYADLARSCWATDPQTRPSFSAIIQRLQAILAFIQTGVAAPPTPSAPETAAAAAAVAAAQAQAQANGARHNGTAQWPAPGPPPGQRTSSEAAGEARAAAGRAAAAKGAVTATAS